MKNYALKVKKTLRLKGKIQAPPSKSYTIRAIILAGLNGKVKILNPLFSEDTEAAIGALKELGARIKKGNNFLKVKGFNGTPSLRDEVNPALSARKHISQRKGGVNVGESGTLLRLILPILALGKGKFLVNGTGTLLKRPHKAIAEALLSLGVSIRGKDNEFRLPIHLEGKGIIAGGVVMVKRAQMSSQTISSLLTVAAFARQDVTLIVKDKVVSKPYIDITIDVLKWAGIKIRRQGYKKFFISAPQSYRPKNDFVIHGDYSSAAFLIAACCLIESDVTITDLASDKQGDRQIIKILNSMGAKIRHQNNRVSIKGPFKLKGRDIDCSDTPDLVPILAVVGCFAQGKTRLYNIGHLAYKESNRIQAPAGELRKLQAKINAGSDSLTIEESALKPGEVCGCNDHRIAMALAVCALKIGGVTIKGADCIDKSYPRFILDMKALGARFIINNQENRLSRDNFKSACR